MCWVAVALTLGEELIREFAFAEDMRAQQHLITRDVNHYVSRYEVCGFRGSGSM